MLSDAHNSSATRFVEEAHKAMVELSMQHLVGSMKTYVHDVHNKTLEDYNDFSDGGTIDTFVDGRHQEENPDDQRFETLVRQAIHPQGAIFDERQLQIAECMGKFVLGADEAQGGDHNPAWELTVLRVMEEPGFDRFDLAAGFLYAKSVQEHNNILLNGSATLHSIYKKLLVLSAMWDKDIQLSIPDRTIVFHGNVTRMHDGTFSVEHRGQNRWLRRKVLPMLHALLPEIPNNNYTNSPNWNSWYDSPEMQTLPGVVTKVRALLAILALRLQLPAKIDEYVRPLRKRAARMRLWVVFCALKARVLSARAVARVQVDYANGGAAHAAVFAAYLNDPQLNGLQG